MIIGAGIQIFDVNAGGGGGGVLTLDNGLTLSGTNGQLGGQLTQNTLIQGGNGELLGIILSNAALSATFIADPNSAITLDYVGGGFTSNIALSGGGLVISLSQGANSQGFSFDQTGGALSVFDTLGNAGLIYQNTIPYLAAGIKLAGWIPYSEVTPVIVAKADLPIQTTAQTILTWALSNINITQDITVRISGYLNTDVAGGTVKLTVSFRNLQNVLQTIDLTPVVSAAGSIAVTPLTLKVLRNTTITVQSVVTAGSTYSCGAFIERLNQTA